MCMVLCFCMSWFVFEKAHPSLVGWREAVRQRRTIQLRLSSFFAHLVIIQLFLPRNSRTLYIHAKDFFRCHLMSYSPHGAAEVCFKKLSSAKLECLIKFARFSPPLVLVLFGQLWALFAPTMCSGPQCLHPQWSSMSSLLLVWQLPVQATSTSDTLALYNLKTKITGTVSVQLEEQGTGIVSVQLEEQHLLLLVGTSEVPPPVQHNAKPGSLCWWRQTRKWPGGENGRRLFLESMDTFPIWSRGPAQMGKQAWLRERGNKLCCHYIFQFRHGGGGEGGFYSGGY